MDGFRAVYHEAPGDVHAPDSVNAVAELLAEQGRSLHDAKSLKAAVGQYEFLRTQYPGSSLRVGALLAEAQIYQNDLHDSAAARERYELAGEAVSAQCAGGGGEGGDRFARSGKCESGRSWLRRALAVRGRRRGRVLRVARRLRLRLRIREVVRVRLRRCRRQREARGCEDSVRGVLISMRK